MSDYAGLIAELNANATIPGKQLEAIMTAYPTCWGYAAPLTDKKTGVAKLLTAAIKLPEGWTPKDIQDMKAELRGTPEMMEFFGKFPEGTDDVCMQPFPLLEDDKGNVTLALFLEGDFDHWAKEDEPHHSPEYICYRDKIGPLVNSLSEMLSGNVTKIVKKIGSTEYQDIFEGTFGERGVIYFLADNGASQLIEQNDKRKDEDWGGISNEVPEVETPTTIVEEPVEQPVEQPGLSLAEKRKLRQAAEAKKPDGVHTTTATPKSVLNKQNTTISEQRVLETLKTTTAAAPAKGPFIFTLPKTITTEAEAKAYWQTNFGTCPDMWKHKDAAGNWVPSLTAGFPYEKAAKNSVIRDKFNTDGSLKSATKGFGALDDVATGKTAAPATTTTPDPDAARPATVPGKLPLMPTAVRDKVIAEVLKLDLKSRPIMSNDEIKAAEAKHSSVYVQLKNMPVEELWRMSYEELDKLNRSYPDFGSVWLFALRNYQMQNWKRIEEPKKEEAVVEAAQPEQGLTLAQKRALRKAAAA